MHVSLVRTHEGKRPSGYPAICLQKAHSTETALLRVQNDILTSIDRKRGTFLIFLDLSAAFDTVDHDLLLSLLETNTGLTESVLSSL